MRLSHLVRRNAAGKGVAYLSCLAFAGLGYKLKARISARLYDYQGTNA